MKKFKEHDTQEPIEPIESLNGQKSGAIEPKFSPVTGEPTGHGLVSAKYSDETMYKINVPEGCATVFAHDLKNVPKTRLS